MHFIRQKKTNEYSLGLTPLIDIVLLLLIFFILTASSSSMSGLTIDLPEISRNFSDIGQPSAIITLDSNGTLYLNGTTTERAQLEDLLKSIISVSKPNTKVVIGADKDTKHSFVVDAMDIAQQSGASSIAIMAVWQDRSKK